MNSDRITKLWSKYFIVRSPAKNDYFKLNDVLLDNYDTNHKELWQLFQFVNDRFWTLPAFIRDIDHFSQAYATSLYIIELFILLDLHNVHFNVAISNQKQDDQSYVLINCFFNDNIKIQFTCKSDTYNYNSGFHTLFSLHLSMPIPY